MNYETEALEIKKKIGLMKARLNIANMKEKGLDKSYKNHLKEMREYELKTQRRKKSMILKKTHLSTVIYTS